MYATLMKRAGEQLKNNLPFVIYRKPKQAMLKAIFQSDAKLHKVTDFSESGFVFAPFQNIQNTVLIPLEEVMEVAVDSAIFNSETSEVNIPITKGEEHKALVAKAIREIEIGTIEKVVLTRSLQQPTKKNPLALFQELLALYESAFCYLWHHPKVGTWLGATPEILLKVENKNFTTMSLAGTQAYEPNKEVKWEAKELREQSLVTEYILNALEGNSKNLDIGSLETVRAGKLLHLRTKVTGMATSSLIDLLSALHPTPAVCGIPIATSRRFLLDNEGYDREFYTGFLGELNFKKKLQRSGNRRNQENQAYSAIKTQSEFFVNLRCMKLEGNKAKIYVGGGVTRESVPENEWQETVKKSGTMLQVLT